MKAKQMPIKAIRQLIIDVANKSENKITSRQINANTVSIFEGSLK